jgi:hypothetical protein
MNTLLLLIAFLASALQNAPTGASLQGLITNEASGSPLPDTGVELISVEAASRKYTVATGGDGMFSFKDVPPGNYRVAAARPGFVRAEYGQRGPGGNGRTITVAAGDNVKDIQIALVATGAISGRILDSKGRPMPNVQVQALRFTNIGVMRFVETVTAAITNDLGEYRLFWLPPNEYIVMAMPIRGTVEDTLIRTDGNGYTINNRVRPSAGNLIPAPTELPPMPFFFRDGNDPSNASRISIRPADSLRGIDIMIRPPATYVIRGKLVNMPSMIPAAPTPGRPFMPEVEAPEIELEPRTQPAVRFRDSMPNGLVRADYSKGTFEIRGVLPGAYWVSARVAGKEARAQVDVAGKDVEDVAISFVNGFDVPIRVSMDGQPEGPNFDRLIDSLRVGLRRPEGPGEISAEEVDGQPPGTFVAHNVEPGTYSLSWSIAGESNAYIKAVRVEGIETQTTFRLDQSPLRPIEVIWGLSNGVITGVVTNSKLEPASDVTVVAISPNRGSRYATSGPDGRFRITAVPPGDFRVYAWEAIPRFSWQNPQVMQRDFVKGIPVHLDDGSNVTVNPTALPPPASTGQ